MALYSSYYGYVHEHNEKVTVGILGWYLQKKDVDRFVINFMFFSIKYVAGTNLSCLVNAILMDRRICTRGAT